jgi:hypothetical protein
VTTAKLADEAVTSSKIKPGAVISSAFTYIDVTGDGSTEWSVLDNPLTQQTVEFFSPSFTTPNPDVDGPFFAWTNHQAVMGAYQTANGSSFHTRLTMQVFPQKWNGTDWVTDNLSTYPYNAALVGYRPFEISRTFNTSGSGNGSRSYVYMNNSFYFAFEKNTTYRWVWKMYNYDISDPSSQIENKAVSWYGDAFNEVFFFVR